ncbi:glycosyltransferase family 2 protein [Cereibacter changlensis]|uniref:Glycosyltransferase family 2 protein n=1 Tax=Cereibacter changlensis TaxID=402884 RepID=A0A4U0YRR4_9RHOB|nr:glycosyltransferase [Cereibacter changlensis]TKA95200.1 glycosyltransferase family 2 protein [Cereibacter changlensis]
MSPLPPDHTPLVQVRTPTYRRPAMLRRCLQSLQAQTWSNWVCDVQDDSPDSACEAVVRALGDPRIHYRRNEPRLYASKNIDSCFSRKNPRNADYFCLVEDDNWLLPEFMRANIELARREGVEVVLRNQLVELGSGTEEARLSAFGILDGKFVEGRYDPGLFRLALMADIGMSHGGLFWSRKATSDFEIGFPVSATLQEYMRTYAVEEPIYVALEPLAVWAENGEDTTRNLGARVGYLRRELTLKRSIAALQRRAWQRATPEDREGFLTSPRFRYAKADRARGMVKSLTRLAVGDALPAKEHARLVLRGAMIRVLGRVEPGLQAFFEAREAEERGFAAHGVEARGV